ncbi:hypothetical protein [Alsobacter soli]|uniref:hypothetical protein n=1 Tax=Alsobacter soli TaxID=2109933 RepID=UPI0011B25073|nr:hypothetical protein [Alsobacter soli]
MTVHVDQDTVERHPKSYDGWALRAALRLCPELLASSFYFSPLRRQCLFLALATFEIGQDVEIRARLLKVAPAFLNSCSTLGDGVARSLAMLRAKAMLEAILGQVPPPGLLGTLARLGSQPLPLPGSYERLVGIFKSRSPLDRQRAKVLGQISGPIAVEMLRVLHVLDPIFLHPAVVANVNVPTAYAANAALRWVREHCSTASDANIRESFVLFARGGLKRWLRAWAERMTRLPFEPPVNFASGFIPLASGPAMLDAGRRFRNCLAEKVPEVALGRRYYVELMKGHSSAGAIVELSRISTGWLLASVYGPNNDRVPLPLQEEIRIMLRNAGISVPDHAPGDPDYLAKLAESFGMWGWNRDRLDGSDLLIEPLDEPA